MKIDFFAIKPCRAGQSFELIPKKNIKIDLNEIAISLKKNKIKIVLETSFLINFLINDKKISLFSNGKIRINDVSEKEEAKKLGEKALTQI